MEGQSFSSPGAALISVASSATRGLVEGDRALRRLSVRAGTSAPSILYFTSEAAADVSVFGRWAEGNQILFGLVKATQRVRAAELRVHFALRPSPDREDMGSEWLTPVFLPPAFLLDSGEPGSLRIRPQGGEVLHVEVSTGGLWARLGDGPRLPLSHWPFELVEGLLGTLAQYVSMPAVGLARPFALLVEADTDVPTNSLDGLITLIFKGYDRVWENLEAAVDQRMDILAGFFPPAYRLAKLEARMSAWVDRHGRIVSHAEDVDATQVDLRVTVEPDVYGAQARFQSSPAGFLVQGDLHRKFLQSLQNSASDLFANSICTSFGLLPTDRYEPDSRYAEFQGYFLEFLTSTVLRATFARLNAMGDELILLKGIFKAHRGSLLLTAKMMLEDSGKVSLDTRSARVLASTLRGGEQKLSLARDDNEPLRRYLELTLRQWDAWQLRMAK